MALALSTVAVACKTKTVSTTSNETTLDAQLVAVQTRFPDATKAELQKGHSIYTGACTECHRKKKVTKYTEVKLLNIVDVMAKKAKLTAEEKQALIRFAIGVRATSK